MIRPFVPAFVVAFATSLSTVSLLAQDTAPRLPAAGSPESVRQLDAAVDKLLAFGRGAYVTKERQDHAMMRDVGVRFAMDATEVRGGWHRGLIWGAVGGNEFVTGGGRMLVKIDGQWRLRRDRLAKGLELPFVFDPGLFCHVLKAVPERDRRIERVEADRRGGRDVVVMTVRLDGDSALELADSGALPGEGGTFRASPAFFGGAGGAIEIPRPEYVTWLAFTIDEATGDLVEVATKSYEKHPMFMGGAIAVNVVGRAVQAEDAVEEEQQPAKEKGVAPEWIGGLPTRKPEKGESVTTYQVQFEMLGRAELPNVASELLALLRGQ